VMHSEDDQIVPYVAAGPLSAKLLRNCTFKSYKNFPHGMPTTEAGTINADLLSPDGAIRYVRWVSIPAPNGDGFVPHNPFVKSNSGWSESIF
jgi:hypothetical protein